MTVHDISVPISQDTVSWRDRFGVQVDWHSRTSFGDRTTNSTWRLHAHTGTHLDAPVHHVAGGEGIDELPVEDGIGRCRVVDLTDTSGHIGSAQLARVEPRRGERLLLRTRNSTRGLLESDTFADDYVGITDDGARYLGDVGIKLIGIDHLSVEPPGSTDSPTHHTLMRSGIRVLEGLLLNNVREGDYLLVFLPLKLVGADAAPGRALLIEEMDSWPT